MQTIFKVASGFYYGNKFGIDTTDTNTTADQAVRFVTMMTYERLFDGRALLATTLAEGLSTGSILTAKISPSKRSETPTARNPRPPPAGCFPRRALWARRRPCANVASALPRRDWVAADALFFPACGCGVRMADGALATFGVAIRIGFAAQDAKRATHAGSCA